MSDREYIEYQKTVSDLADKIMDRELAKGAAFTEGLCNWALNRAMEQVPDPRYK